MHLPVNTQLHGGIYRIIRFISSGGFGCTYEAEHIMLGKRVAIKEFFVKDFCNRDKNTSHVTLGTLSKKALVDKLRKKFLDEAKGLSKLRHPGIVSVSDVFEENGTAYFVMDYIDGKSLGDMVREEGFLPEKRAVGYIKKVSEALRYVHENNRLHLDLKPGNIMVDGNDNPILIDFGASKQYDEESGENTSTLMGKTPGYASIEQMSNSVMQFFPATDIYALGATLYKLLTGITPTDVTLLASGEKLPPLPATISSQIRATVSAAMQMDKSRRPQSIDEFLRLLNDAAPAVVPTGNHEATVLKTKKEPVGRKNNPEKPSDPEPKKKRSLLPILIAAGVITGVLTGFFVMRGLRSDGREDNIVAQTQIVDSDSLDYFNEDIVILQPKEDNAAERKAEEERIVQDKREREVKEETEQKAKAEEEHLVKEQREAAEKAEAERKAREAIESKRREEERLANEQREAAEKAEAERKAREAAEAKRREEEQKRNSVNIEMVYVAGGTFTMGAVLEHKGALYDYSTEKPTHKVTVSSFYIGKYEVTQKQWIEVMGSNPSKWKGDDRPVERVTWNDVQDFIKKLNAKTGKNYRLPTEAEWEFAARGGNNSKGYEYSGSDKLGEVAWYNMNTVKIHPVGQKLPNELGIYDMTGNVDEWCSDWYDSNYYSNSPTNNPKGPNFGSERVLRGGSWRLPDRLYRVSYRSHSQPNNTWGGCGFRLAMDAQ